MPDIQQAVAKSVGPAQLIAKLCDEIGFEDLLNDQLEWDPVRCHRSPGQRIKAMVINILCHRQPLYRVEEFYEKQDVENLFGPDVEADDFNDDSLARGLDKLHEAGAWQVYSSLSMSAVKALGLPIGVLHNDTTSVSVYGEYDRPGELNITQGYSKDHRPDLKQIMMGLSVTQERIPVLATMENGNTSDQKWNLAFIDKLRKTLSDEAWRDLLYQADSALITKENLQNMDTDFRFLSRLPERYQLSQKLKDWAWEKNKWTPVGSLSDQKEAAAYQIQSTEQKWEGRTYRFLVVHSDQLDKRKRKTFEKQLAKEKKQLQTAFGKLEKQTFQCAEDAHQALTQFQKDHMSRYFRIEGATQAEQQPVKRPKRGRPKKGEQSKTQTVYRVQQTQMDTNQLAIDRDKRFLSTFILITNETERYEDRELLKIYKGQSAAETRFRFLKNPQMLHGIYLKYPHRVEALGIVFVMALLLYGILEYRVRQRLGQEKEPLILPGGRKSFRPTGQALLEKLTDVQVLIVEAQATQRFLLDNADETTKRIVQLAGYDMTIYVSDAFPASTN